MYQKWNVVNLSFFSTTTFMYCNERSKRGSNANVYHTDILGILYCAFCAFGHNAIASCIMVKWQKINGLVLRIAAKAIFWQIFQKSWHLRYRFQFSMLLKRMPRYFENLGSQQQLLHYWVKCQATLVWVPLKETRNKEADDLARKGSSASYISPESILEVSKNIARKHKRKQRALKQ